MSVKCVETRLGPGAELYLEESLKDGHTLAKLVLEVIRFESGYITTFLPPNVAPESIKDFRTGGKLPSSPEPESYVPDGQSQKITPVPNTDADLAFVVKGHLRLDKRRVCAMEDALKRPGDLILKRLKTRYATFENEIYHLLFHTDAGTNNVENVLKTAKSLPTFVGLLTSCSHPPGLATDGTLSLTELRELAIKVNKIFVGAYDGEGYLLWNKRS